MMGKDGQGLESHEKHEVVILKKGWLDSSQYHAGIKAILMGLAEINTHEFRVRLETQYCVFSQLHLAEKVQPHRGKELDSTKPVFFSTWLWQQGRGKRIEKVCKAVIRSLPPWNFVPNKEDRGALTRGRTCQDKRIHGWVVLVKN